LADAHERTRKEEVRVKRIEGRGPPKKGEGRRSQMKRK
jgi:small subunit ribosomal protein S33